MSVLKHYVFSTMWDELNRLPCMSKPEWSSSYCILSVRRIYPLMYSCSQIPIGNHNSIIQESYVSFSQRLTISIPIATRQSTPQYQILSSQLSLRLLYLKQGTPAETGSCSELLAAAWATCARLILPVGTASVLQV